MSCALAGRAKWVGSFGAGLLVLGTGCTDPRPRPAPPVVEVTLAANHVVSSPGEVIGSIYASDPHGIQSLSVSVRSSDNRLVGDSTFSVSPPFETTLPLLWQVPPGLSPGIGIQVAVRAVNYVGFAAADTVYAEIGSALRFDR